MNSALELIKKFEGCRLTAYKCPAGRWTLGYGHTQGVTPGQVITQEQAEEYLKEDIATTKAMIEKAVLYPLNANQIEALVSFVYNIGIGAFIKSTLRAYLNKDLFGVAATQFELWDHVDGKKLAGLTKRRLAEKELFIKPIKPINPITKGARNV